MYATQIGLIFIPKILERIVAKQISGHLNSHGLSNIWQSAYKPAHSTESALLCVKNDLHLNAASGSPSALVLLDLSAAFDTIDHNILLKRLSIWFGLGSTVLNWFQSYLTNRFQRVKVGNIMSNRKNLEFGVPQGSVLGPLLFTMYTTPISKIITFFKGIQHHLYADDTQVYISLTPGNSLHAMNQLSNCLGKIQDWMSKNRLKLNPDKTEFLLVGSQQSCSKVSGLFPFDLLGNSISPSDKVRNLGVIFDTELSLTHHISAVCKSSYYYIRDLCRIRRHLSFSVAMQLANALISSRLDYCNSLFTSLSNKNVKRLQSIQNTAARIIMRISKRSSISSKLKNLHWLPVQFRIKFKIGVLVYKALTTKNPPYLASLLSFHSSVKNTRRSNPELRFLHEFHPGFRPTSTRHLSHSFQHMAPRLWNSFPLDVRSAPSLGIFRRRLKAHLFNLAFPP